MSGSGRRALAAVLAAGLLAAGVGLDTRAAADQERDFPHQEHAGLFPFCMGCHQDVAAPSRAARFPDAELCGRCHDGEELSRVDWRLEPAEPSNLRFRHADHPMDTTVNDRSVDCVTCHTASGEPRMAVEAARAGRCLSCHEHRAEEHYADAACSTCHMPLAESGLPGSRLEAIPAPASHERDDFLLTGHGEMARAGTESCATCHARERCASCHVDAGRVPEIARVPAASGRLDLPSFGAEYPTPPSHRREGWLENHGRQASRAECSACHTRESCASCHRADAPDVVDRLASAEEAPAPGVSTERKPPASHASPSFTTGHGALAAADGSSCSSCHTEATCTECHESQRRPRYHPPNFMARHSTEAYGARMECSNCHDARAFCRECHAQLGMQTEGRLGGGFHDAKPFWLFQHGQAARQSLQTCRTCHTQRDCLQCHSQTGAFQVNPHGPSFDPERAHDRNPQICFACHLTDPLRGGAP